jgi:hypothetical protein
VTRTGTSVTALSIHTPLSIEQVPDVLATYFVALAADRYAWTRKRGQVDDVKLGQFLQRAENEAMAQDSAALGINVSATDDNRKLSGDFWGVDTDG